MIRSFRHFALTVPDLKVGVGFYSDFGLEPVERKDHVAMRCKGRPLDQVVLFEGKKKRLHHLSFATRASELPALQAKLEAEKVRLLDAPYAGAPGGLWFNDLDGNLVNIVAEDPVPTRTFGDIPYNAGAHLHRKGDRAVMPRPAGAEPTRLGHTIQFSKDPAKASEFYTRVLGMQLSDTIGGGFAYFMRTAGGSDHHVLGLIKSNDRGLHHASFEVESVDDIALGGRHLLSKGVKHVYGLGRHVVGSNFFHYFRDPWNSMAEYFYDIDYVPENYPWEPQDWEPKSGFALWSNDPGPPPEDFGHNYEAN